MKQNLAYDKARTNSETLLPALTLHCVSTPIKSYNTNDNAALFVFFCLRTFRTRFLGVETQCNFKAGFY